MEHLNLKTLVIVGAGGHGREVLWVARNINQVRQTYSIVGFCDDNPDLSGQMFCDLPILGTPEAYDASPDPKPHFIVGIGDNQVRRQLAERLMALGWIPETLIDPSAVVAEDVTIGPGCYVGVVSNISPSAVIGQHVIVHNQSSVGHDTDMADYSQVAPGGRVLGHVRVGECGYLGSNAVIAPGKKLGAESVLGACSFAIEDIPAHSVAIGVPARVRIQSKP